MNPKDEALGNPTAAAGGLRSRLAHMRHELRTPLNAIIGYSEMLLEEAAVQEHGAIASGLRNLHETGMRLLLLINEILNPAAIAAAPPGPGGIAAVLGQRLRGHVDGVIAGCAVLSARIAEAGLDGCIADLERIREAGLRLLALLEKGVDLTEGEAGGPDAATPPGGIASLPGFAVRLNGRAGAGPEAASLLVVDDTESNRDILARWLERQGHKVAKAASGSEALSLWQSRHFDLMLLDIVMPDLNGYQVLEKLKAEHPASQVPVIFISALDDPLGKVQAFGAGGVDYVTKPFQPEEVIARVENQLKIARLQRDLERQNQELLRKNEELSQAQKRTDLVFSALADALPGTVLDGKYRLEKKIGTGGFGAVFCGTHLGLNLAVAIKVFRPLSGNDTADALERFRQEGIAAARIKHPNAVEIFDNGISTTGIAYLVMELLRGRTLGSELQEKQTLPPRRAAEILVPVCEALAELHAAGVVHRDLKPENIYLHEGRHGEVVKLLDFGLAKLVEAAEDQTLGSMSMSTGIAGTPAYMAPERLLSRAYNGLADIYSLGVIMYRMLCGRFPFEPEQGGGYAAAMMQLTSEPASLLKHDPRLPESFDLLVRRMLSKIPERRPAATELVPMIRAFLPKTAPFGV
jgi:CheY-like chemotaxis protein